VIRGARRRLGLLHLPEDERQLRVLGRQLELELVIMLLLELGQRKRLGRQLLELADGLWPPVAPQRERVPRAKPVLEVLRRSKALKLAVDHDAHPRAEGLALFHRVGSEDDGLAATDHLKDAVPQKAARARVHPGRWLVLKEKEKSFQVPFSFSRSQVHLDKFDVPVKIARLESQDRCRSDKVVASSSPLVWHASRRVKNATLLSDIGSFKKTSMTGQTWHVINDQHQTIVHHSFSLLPHSKATVFSLLSAASRVSHLKRQLRGSVTQPGLRSIRKEYNLFSADLSLSIEYTQQAGRSFYPAVKLHPGKCHKMHRVIQGGREKNKTAAAGGA
jgi:hypothetical protein